MNTHENYILILVIDDGFSLPPRCTLAELYP